MRSIDSSHGHPSEAWAPPELVAAYEEYAFLTGRLHALIYELTSPFGRPR
ncbi:hypothetical protein [Mycobacterium paraffinicum]|uniref:Uncharacterized protein n=1 Tax=Mycobacterium paraffinicum TaxID=53378 RepID=A0ABP8FA31_9MYCO|nr:hypothetical protein [Mycobacterium paraffinicum]